MINSASMLGVYRRAYGESPRGVIVSRTPGRVNIIGEHTDYNDGFVLPTPIDRHIWIAAKPKEDMKVSLYAADYNERTSFDIEGIEFDEGHPWSNYVIGVADAMVKRGYALGGANMAIKGDVPIGAGLSSSAAIEVAVAKAFARLFNLDIDPVELAYIGKSAENDFVGVQCGVMDQFVGSLGRRGHALFIDCRTNQYEHIPLDPDYFVVVVNTMVKRELTSSAYNERRRQCEEGVRVLRKRLPNVAALRDVSGEDLERHWFDLPEAVHRRCRHVVAENRRVLEAVDALKRGDMEGLGRLLYESHLSLRDDYEVSCRELDMLVEMARGIPGTIGARMTGAGFGGCTVNIVEREHANKFSEKIKERYKAATGLSAEAYMA